jgi:hypothetical protein
LIRHPTLDAGSHIGWWEIPTSYAMPNNKEIPDKGLLSSANSGMTELVLFFAVIPHLMRDLPIEVEPTFYAMPNSKEIPDKGLLRSANSGMTELVLFLAVIPRLMRDLILAGGKYQLHMPCLIVKRFLIKASCRRPIQE